MEKPIFTTYADALLKKLDERPIVLPALTLPPDCSSLTTDRPDDLFVLKHLVIESFGNAPTLLFDIRVGRNSQLAASGVLDARAFTTLPSILIEKLRGWRDSKEAKRVLNLIMNLGIFDTVQSQMDVSVLLCNPTGVKLSCAASVYGDHISNDAKSEDIDRYKDENRPERKRHCLFGFDRPFQNRERLHVEKRPQVVLRPERLVYAGKPGAFILHDILIGRESAWKAIGKKPIPMEDFAPISKSIMGLIMEEAPFVQIAKTWNNVSDIGRAVQVSQPVGLDIECVGPADHFMAHFICDAIE